jgi:hypothetical protein
MSRLRYLNPFRIRDAARQIRRISGGGPRRLRLVSVGHPEGVIVPTSRITLAVEARDGTKTKLEPELPVPWPNAWTWRLARLLKVPLVRSVEPEHVSFSVAIPHRRGAARRAGS